MADLTLDKHIRRKYCQKSLQRLINSAALALACSLRALTMKYRKIFTVPLL